MTAATKILVTGSEGFLGTAVVQALLEQHPEFHVIGLDLVQKHELKHDVNEKSTHRYQFLQADVRDIDVLRAALFEASPDLVVHTAGIVPQPPGRYTRHV